MQIVAGSFVTGVSLMVISSTTKKSNNLTTKLNQPLMENEEDNHERLDSVTKINGETVDQDEMHSFPITSATIFFQLLLVLASVYYAMLLTNWGNPTIF